MPSEKVNSKKSSQWEGTVLLAEDDQLVLEITRTLLAKMGFTVLIAVDGADAVEVFRQHQDDILFVVSDFAMPRLNGLEALHKIRQINPEIQMILASGYSEEQVMEEEPTERPACFLKKPFSSQALEKAIDCILTR